MASNSKRKSKVLNVEAKLEILNSLAKGESGSSLAPFYNVGKLTISDMKKSRETLLNFAPKLDSEDGSNKRKTTGKSNDIVPDRAFDLGFSQRSKGDPISGYLLCEKALEFNEKLSGSADFKTSTGWLKNFKSRHVIQELQIECESLSGHKNFAHKFKETFL
ncbi:jerky protein homolog-like [Trichonephila clavipes]|nr:jerky protein homolog-like [Trichonephila clavipes]